MLIFSIVTIGFLNIGQVGKTVQAASPPSAWEKFYDFAPADTYAYSVIQTSDGGYALAGYLYRYPATPTGYYGLLLKLDANGNQQWNLTYRGGSAAPQGAWVHSMIQTNDGGYVL